MRSGGLGPLVLPFKLPADQAARSFIGKLSTEILNDQAFERCADEYERQMSAPSAADDSEMTELMEERVTPSPSRPIIVKVKRTFADHAEAPTAAKRLSIGRQPAATL